MKAIFVSQFEPTPIGHGGNHRAYQIVHDLGDCFGPEHVVTVTYPDWHTNYRPATSVPPPPRAGLLRRLARGVPPLRWSVQRLRQLRQRLQQYRQRAPYLSAESPLDLLIGSGTLRHRFAHPAFIAHYESVVRQIERPAVCVIEHIGFAALLPLNKSFGVATIACIQNIEALDTPAPLPRDQQRVSYQMAINLADELDVLAQCQERLFISRVETALVGGLGLPSAYYPYLPVGAIRNNLIEIARMREQQPPTPGLFLMLGSGGHTTTRHSFQWFVNQAQAHGLPDGVQVIVAGSKTDSLLPEGAPVPGLQLRGWVEQVELDDLLVQAQAVLAPQTVGFGALTRLPELALAGIPVITSEHPTYAIQPPPGIAIAGDSWPDWREAMLRLIHRPHTHDAQAYCAWETAQTNHLKTTLNKYISA